MSGTKYVGLDVHKATTVAAVLDGTGRLVMESIVETKTETLRDFVRGLSGKVDGVPSGAWREIGSKVW